MVARSRAYRLKQRTRDSPASQAAIVCNFGLVFFFFSHVKMCARLVRWRAVCLKIQRRLNATPQSLKGVMSIAVEKRNLTANNLSGQTLTEVSVKCNLRSLGGNS